MKKSIKVKRKCVPEKTNSLREVATNVAERTEKDIKEGKKKTKASNGTPMEKLHGAARATATLKNIGKESYINGGMKDGMNTIILNAKANTIIDTLDYIEENKIIKKSSNKEIEGEK